MAVLVVVGGGSQCWLQLIAIQQRFGFHGRGSNALIVMHHQIVDGSNKLAPIRCRRCSCLVLLDRLRLRLRSNKVSELEVVRTCVVLAL